MKRSSWGRALFGVLLAVPALASAQTVLNGYFVEADGLVVIEAESIGTFPDDWKNASSSTAPDLDNSAGNPTGGDFLTWEGSQFFNNPGVSVLVYRVQINNPGTYRFRWRSQTGLGTNTTEHNDTWVRIEGDAFYGEKGNGSLVCPKGYDPAENDCTGGTPNGGGGNGWFKVYTSGANSWNWNARTSDNDAHNIYARFDQPGVYDLRLAARSSFHLIDRMVLVSDAYGGNETNTSLPQSPFVAGDPPPPPPEPDPDPDPEPPPPPPPPGTGNIAVSLVNAASDQRVRTLTDGARFGIGEMNLSSWSAEASTVPSGTASVTFTLSGVQSTQQTENVAPYALFGDSNGNFDGQAFVIGEYTLTVRAHSGADGSGTVLGSLTLKFTVVDDVIEPGDVLFEDGFEPR
ncbi:MAG: hypothetical protein V2I57_12620 [Xanthomonadales bacterium]|jgi:hypothetical protein|nr:hypothetical protein [Xanthomonadales bacterium]